jgi:hypothetical protein
MQARLCYLGAGAVETKKGGSKGIRRKPMAHRQTFPSFFKLTRIRCRISQPTEANVSCSILAASVTNEHTNAAFCSTCHQSIGGSGEPGELGRSNPGTPKPAAPEDLGAGVASPGAAPPGTLMPVSNITQSRSKPPVPSPSRGLASSTSTLTVPSDAPSIPGACHVFLAAMMPPRESTGVSPGMR